MAAERGMPRHVDRGDPIRAADYNRIVDALLGRLTTGEGLEIRRTGQGATIALTQSLPRLRHRPYVLTVQRLSADAQQTIPNNTPTVLTWPTTSSETFEYGRPGLVTHSAGRFTVNAGTDVVFRVSAWARVTGSQASGGFEDVNGWHQLRLESVNSNEEWMSCIPGVEEKALVDSEGHTIAAHYHAPRSLEGYFLSVPGALLQLSEGDWFEFKWHHVSAGTSGSFQQGRVFIEQVR